jgi:hypothetical protein
MENPTIGMTMEIEFIKSGRRLSIDIKNADILNVGEVMKLETSESGGVYNDGNIRIWLLGYLKDDI